MTRDEIIADYLETIAAMSREVNARNSDKVATKGGGHLPTKVVIRNQKRGI